MDKAKYEQTIAQISKARLGKSLKDMLSVAEDAWKSQAQSVRLIDHNNDEVAGEDSLLDLTFALEQWILELEIIANAAQKIAKRANKTLHASGSYPEIEIDGEGYGIDAEGVEGVTANSRSEAVNRTGRRRHHVGRRAAGNGNPGIGTTVRKNPERCAEKCQKVFSRGI